MSSNTAVLLANHVSGGLQCGDVFYVDFSANTTVPPHTTTTTGGSSWTQQPLYVPYQYPYGIGSQPYQQPQQFPTFTVPTIIPVETPCVTELRIGQVHYLFDGPYRVSMGERKTCPHCGSFNHHGTNETRACSLTIHGIMRNLFILDNHALSLEIVSCEDCFHGYLYLFKEGVRICVLTDQSVAVTTT